MIKLKKMILIIYKIYYILYKQFKHYFLIFLNIKLLPNIFKKIILDKLLYKNKLLNYY